MSGSRSTRNWLYENRPSTHSAAMTMVAKTGLLMETRVNHMTCSLPRLASALPQDRTGADAPAALARTGAAPAPDAPEAGR